ncbi:MAG: MMPL family transporter [Desulfuromonadales bacterium]|nr:MMPL family transporter [Desulfuromonadales bacterium]
MNRLTLTSFSLRHPWLVVLLTLLASIVFLLQFPKVNFDNDPENMLDKNEHVRLFHHEVKEKYALYDFVIVGIVNEDHPDGIFNVDTLGRIDRLTRQLLYLYRTDQGEPAIRAVADAGSRDQILDLRPQGSWQRLLNTAFNHDPNRLFDENGQSVIIGQELIAPSVVDNLKQAKLGALKLEYLMEEPPRTRDEALVIRDDAMGNPLYAGTLVAEDEKAICLYIPIVDKTYSYTVANLVRHLTRDWPVADQVHITGLPVAEDTFGIEMLVQMATSAPLAGLAIFLLLFFFFRKLTLIIAPMVVAVVSVICTMGLLIGLGFDVHIMSSMIAIFLMPIAVADSVHILSEFYDTYPRFRDRAETLRHVIGHLFRPMLFTSLTTMAGFASLATTPIPPVQVFGLHVAFGVGLAWLLSITLIPAYVMLAVPDRRLASLTATATADAPGGALDHFLTRVGAFSTRRYRPILLAVCLLVATAVYGISQIKVNDNPVKWFMPSHEIRIADEILNRHFGGTYTAYLTLEATRPGQCNCVEKAEILAAETEARFGSLYPEATVRFLEEIAELRQRYGTVSAADAHRAFVALITVAEEIDEENLTSWQNLADAVNYLDPEGLDLARLEAELGSSEGIRPADRQSLLAQLGDRRATGLDLIDAALEVTDRYTASSFTDFVYEMEAEMTAPLFKQPQMLRYLAGLQAALAAEPVVGKSSSVVDALRKANFELNFLAPPAGLGDAELAAYRERNRSFFAVPESAAAAGQVYVQLEGMKKKDSLFHMVTRDYQEANLWVQLTSGDNQDMEQVVGLVESYLAENPPPTPLKAEWAGLTYLNVVWQDKMVRGMIGSLAGSFVVVLIMMSLLFRSPLYGVFAMIPLSVTITLIYGIIGLVGKDYDMPVAVLSALTLGLSVDFAIHFLQRARELQREFGSWPEAALRMFREPALAISRNAIIIAVGFTPLLLAPLVPYRTVGFFLATIMAVSWLATLFILPTLLTVFQKAAFGERRPHETSSDPSH